MSFSKKWNKIKSQCPKSIDNIDRIILQENQEAQKQHSVSSAESTQALLRQAKAYLAENDDGSLRLVLYPPLATPAKEPERWDAFDKLCADLFNCTLR